MIEIEPTAQAFIQKKASAIVVKDYQLPEPVNQSFLLLFRKL